MCRSVLAVALNLVPLPPWVRLPWAPDLWIVAVLAGAVAAAGLGAAVLFAARDAFRVAKAHPSGAGGRVPHEREGYDISFE